VLSFNFFIKLFKGFMFAVLKQQTEVTKKNLNYLCYKPQKALKFTLFALEKISKILIKFLSFRTLSYHILT
jgi:hypothetical protein